MMPPRPERIVIAGPAGPLQAAVEDPRAAQAGVPAAFAVVCHPNPVQGGTMDNKVVTTLARTCHALSVPTLRFNYRGVGESAGSFDHGVGETEDALAVVAHGRQRWPGAVPWLAGFSFGGYVALRAAPQLADLGRLVTVAPALARRHATPAEVQAPACPWLIVQGEADEVIDAAQVIAWARAIQPPPALAALPGVGHFFHGKLNLLQDTVLDWLRR